MPNLVIPSPTFDAFETLLTLSSSNRAIRWSGGEPPEESEDLIVGSRRFSASQRSHLPRLLDRVRVLVVDDEPDTLELFAVALTTCGADVLIATSAAEALHIVGTRAPDVVVTDIAMPGADGYWLLREIGQLANTQAGAIPVVAVTAFAGEHSRARVLAAGFVDHLEKPLDPEVLCISVARARNR